MNEMANGFSAEIGDPLQAVHSRLGRRTAFLAAIPPALLGLGVAWLLFFWLSPGRIVLGGSTPPPQFCFHDWGPDPVASAVRLGGLAVVGLTLTGGTIVALLRGLPPWAGPWLSTTAAAWSGLAVYMMEDPTVLNNDLIELLLVAGLLALVLLSLVLAGWRNVRSGLLAGLTLSMVFVQSIVFNAAAAPVQRFDVALLVLPVGLVQGALLYLVACGGPVTQWVSAVSVAALALLFDIAVIFWVRTVWQDWLASYGWSDDSAFSAVLSVCPVLFALAVSAARWGWGRLRARLVAV